MVTVDYMNSHLRWLPHCFNRFSKRLRSTSTRRPSPFAAGS